MNRWHWRVCTPASARLFEPDGVPDGVADGLIERDEEVDDACRRRRLVFGRELGDGGMHRRPGELPLGDPDRSEVDLEVFAQFVGVVEAVVLGPVLDEEVEGIDGREVGDETHRDRQSRRGFRKHKARLVIAERVLLPVQEVSRGFHRERIRLDGGA